MSPHRCHVKLVGRACQHDLCVAVNRGVPQDLRCEEAAPDGYGSGGGPSCGCQVPADIEELVARELRDNLQESRRQGFVLIRAA